MWSGPPAGTSVYAPTAGAVTAVPIGVVPELAVTPAPPATAAPRRTRALLLRAAVYVDCWTRNAPLTSVPPVVGVRITEATPVLVSTTDGMSRRRSAVLPAPVTRMR